MSKLGERLTLSQRLQLRWWGMRAWFHRCPECRVRGYGGNAPRWEDDKVAQMLGIATYGCPCCGKGAIEERDERTDPMIDRQPTTSHFGVIYFSGDPTGQHPVPELAGQEPSLTIIACGPEQFCWDSLYQWTSQSPLRDGETAEVLAR